MKKALTIIIDIALLLTAWVLLVLSVGYYSIIDLYFVDLRIAGTIAVISVFLLVLAYTIFWFKRFKKHYYK